MSTSALRQLIAQRFPDAVPLPARRETGVATGVAAFDRILPNGGLPRGRPTLWQEPGVASTALLSMACHTLIHAGFRVAWIDGEHTLGPAWVDGPLVLRPRTPLLGLRFAEVLLASGGFALVVLSGIPIERSVMFRLSRSVHEGGGAFTLVADAALPAALKLKSRFLVEQFQYAPSPFGTPAAIISAAVAIDASASGWQAATVMSLPVINHDVRTALDPGLVDRRGV